MTEDEIDTKYRRFAIVNDGKSLLWNGWDQDFWKEGIHYFISTRESAERMLNSYPGAELIDGGEVI